MTVDVRLRPEAEQDLAESARWYEEQRPGLGQEFLDEALATLCAALITAHLNRGVHVAISASVDSDICR